MTGAERSFASSPHLSALLTLTGRLVQERIAHDLAELGISYAQAAVLVRLWRYGGEMSQTDMIQSLALSRASGTLVLNELAQRELIERRPDEIDARRVIVRLTQAGRDLEPAVLDIFEQVESTIRAPLAEDDVESAFRTLLAVLNAMQRGRRQ
ncbi:MAG TPA: MarR family transcriptional regulator [Candidatus Dormibacteraeota bacterium]|nr:MarR family transcriptional regulator [Candidatus Dormibacteraeota bacterium]